MFDKFDAYYAHLAKDLKLVELTQQTAAVLGRKDKAVFSSGGLAEQMFSLYDEMFTYQTGGTDNGADLGALAGFLVPRVMFALGGDTEKSASICALVTALYNNAQAMSDEQAQEFLKLTAEMYAFYSKPDDALHNFSRYTVEGFIQRAGDMVKFLGFDDALRIAKNTFESLKEKDPESLITQRAGQVYDSVKELGVQWPEGTLVELRPMPASASCVGGNKASVHGIGKIIKSIKPGEEYDGEKFAVPMFMVKFDHKIGEMPDGTELTEVLSSAALFLKAAAPEAA